MIELMGGHSVQYIYCCLQHVKKCWQQVRSLRNLLWIHKHKALQKTFKHFKDWKEHTRFVSNILSSYTYAPCTGYAWTSAQTMHELDILRTTALLKYLFYQIIESCFLILTDYMVLCSPSVWYKLVNPSKNNIVRLVGHTKLDKTQKLLTQCKHFYNNAYTFVVVKFKVCVCSRNTKLATILK